MKITLAKSAGFCFGVKRAVDTVYEQLEMSAAERQPIYTFGPIIHNEEVVRDLEEKGVTVLESVEELEERAAHGGTVIIRKPQCQLISMNLQFHRISHRCKFNDGYLCPRYYSHI